MTSPGLQMGGRSSVITPAIKPSTPAVARADESDESDVESLSSGPTTSRDAEADADADSDASRAQSDTHKLIMENLARLKATHGAILASEIEAESKRQADESDEEATSEPDLVICRMPLREAGLVPADNGGQDVIFTLSPSCEMRGVAAGAEHKGSSATLEAVLLGEVFPSSADAAWAREHARIAIKAGNRWIEYAEWQSGIVSIIHSALKGLLS
jgi:hypothetical protein